MNDETKLTTGSRKKLFWLLAVIILLFGGWSVVWFWAAGRLDQEARVFANTLQADGKVLKCTEQDVQGYPFRIGVFCKNVVYTDPVSGIAVAGSSLRSAAQLYRPGHMVGELDSPFDITLPGLAPLTLEWAGLRKSAKVTTGGLQRLSLVASDFSISANDFGVRDLLANMNELQIHARSNPGNVSDLDFSFSSNDWLVDDNGTGTVVPVDVSLTATFKEFMAALNARRDIIALLKEDGGEVDLADFTFATQNGGRISVSGPLQITRSGRLNGLLTIDLDDPANLVSYATSVFPPAAASLEKFTQYLSAFASNEGGSLKIRDFKITLREGKVIAGFFEIGEIPKLF